MVSQVYKPMAKCLVKALWCELASATQCVKALFGTASLDALAH